jgi:glycerophosphoryl diester phosphodiesterase
VIDLRRRDGRPLRIGHRGAAALAPENTLESIALAVELGCDLVEFDVHAVDGSLVLSHERPRSADGLPSLDDVLSLLGSTRAGVHLDLKSQGSEQAVAAALRRHGLVDRTLVSSFRRGTLRALNAVEPGVRLGRTYPQDRTGLTRRELFHPPARAIVGGLRRALPRWIGALLAGSRATAAVLYWEVVSEPVVARCRALGVPVLVWTVDDPALLPRLDALGVDGVITNDPRIFDGRSAARG